MVTAAVITKQGAPPELMPHRLVARGPGQCTIRVTAAPIVPLDLLCATGTSYFGAPSLPYVPGVQGVGEVLHGDSLVPGTRVWFNTDAGMRPGNGSLAEMAVVDETETVGLPEGVDDAEAGALGLSAVAAWAALTWRAKLLPGEQVLVLGASGVVGQVAVHAARAQGAGRIIAASRQARARGHAFFADADAVVDLSDGDVDEIERRIREAVEGQLQVVIDPVCGNATTAALRVLGDGGRLVNLGSAGGPQATFDSASMRSRSHSILGYTNASLTPAQRSDALTAILGLAAEGRCDVDHVIVGLNEVSDAWRTAATGTRRVVVMPAGSRSTESS